MLGEKKGEMSLLTAIYMIICGLKWRKKSERLVLYMVCSTHTYGVLFCVSIRSCVRDGFFGSESGNEAITLSI